MSKHKLLNIANYLLDDKKNISLEIQLKILLENEYNIDIICIQVTNNFLLNRIFDILKRIKSYYNYFYSENKNTLKKYKNFNLLTLSRFKIIDSSYYYKEKYNINCLISKININENIYSIINTNNIYNKELNILINNENNNINIKNIFILGLSFKKINKYFPFILKRKSLIKYNKIFLKNNTLNNIFFIMKNKNKNKILLIKHYNINDKLLCKEFYNLTLFLY